MQTCTPEWRTSFLREATPALSNVSIDLGVVWRQGKTTETRKIAISTVTKNKNKKKPKKNPTNQIPFEKKNSTLIRLKCTLYMVFACLLG